MSEKLDPTHERIALEARERIQALIARTAITPTIENPQLNIGMEDEYVS